MMKRFLVVAALSALFVLIGSLPCRYASAAEAQPASGFFLQLLTRPGVTSDIGTLRSVSREAMLDLQNSLLKEIARKRNKTGFRTEVAQLVNAYSEEFALAAEGVAGAGARGAAFDRLLDGLALSADKAGVSPERLDIAVLRAAAATEAKLTKRPLSKKLSAADREAVRLLLRITVDQLQRRTVLAATGEALDRIHAAEELTLPYQTRIYAPLKPALQKELVDLEAALADPLHVADEQKLLLMQSGNQAACDLFFFKYAVELSAAASLREALISTVAGRIPGMTPEGLKELGVVADPVTLTAAAAWNFVTPDLPLSYTPVRGLAGQLAALAETPPTPTDFSLFPPPYRALLQLHYDVRLCDLIAAKELNAKREAAIAASRPLSLAERLALEKAPGVRLAQVQAHVKGIPAETAEALMLLLRSVGEEVTGGATADAITAFSFMTPAATGEIDEATRIVKVIVPDGTDITALVASFTTTGASVQVGSTVQMSGITPNNFTSPVAYTVIGADGSAAVYAVIVNFAQEISIPVPPEPASLPQGSPEEQAAYFITLLESPDTQLSGWLGLYDALGVPVVGQDGASVGSTGDDPVGPRFWQVWYASGADLSEGGVPISDVGRQMAAILSEADSAAIGPLLLADLKSAAQSSDPRARLLGQFVRERVLRGTSRLDILDPAVTPDMAVIDLPAVQLISWVAMRGALFRDVSKVSTSGRPTAAALSPAPPGPVEQANEPATAKTTCADLSNEYTGWANWILNKLGGGLQLPGMTEEQALPSFTELIQKKLGVEVSVIQKASKIISVGNLVTTAITLGLQYLAMDYSATQDPLARTYRYDGKDTPGNLNVLVEYNPEIIPDGNELKYCFSSFLLNAFGVTFSFPAKGGIPKTEIFFEAGQGIPELVLFDTSAMKANRVTTDDNGHATINVFSRHLPTEKLACATPVMKEFTILVSAQPEEAGLNSMASIFFDGLGGFTPVGMLSGLMDVLKVCHWKETELPFTIQDWSKEAFCHTTTPAAGETGVDINTAIFIYFSGEMDASTITTNTFHLNNGATGEIAYDPVNRTAIFSPAESLKENTTYTATMTTGIKTKHGYSNPENSTWSFTTAGTAPTVIATSPAAGETATPILITVTFSEAMDPATITPDVLTLSDGVITQSAVYYPDTRTAHFILSSGLAASTPYTATISTGVKDASGNSMASPYTWTFTTRTPQAVSFTNPSNLATGVAVNISITASFGEAMDATTITPATFTVDGVTGTVTYSDIFSTAIFTPTSILASNTTYTATITTGVKNAAGNNLASPYTWTFTTGGKMIAYLTSADIPDPNLLAGIKAAALKSGAVYVTDLQDLGTDWCVSNGVCGNYWCDCLVGKKIANLSGMEMFTNLTKLTLADNKITNLSPLAKLTKLIGLELGGNQITDLSPLANMTQLVELRLAANQIADLSTLSTLTNLTNLTKLDLSNNSITNLAPLAGLTNLTRLELSNNSITNVAPLAGLTNLTWLSLSNRSGYIELNHNWISDVTPLAGMTKLTWLDLGGIGVSDVTPLAGMTDLTYLSLRYHKVVDVSPLAGLTNLKTLDLSDNKSLVHVQPLAALTHLTSLDLSPYNWNQPYLSCMELTAVINALGTAVVWPNYVCAVSSGVQCLEYGGWGSCKNP